MIFSKEEIEIIRSGINSPFWNVFKKHIQEQLDLLAKDILENDELSNVMNKTERDLVRLDWKRVKWFLESPEKIVESGGNVNFNPPSNDPYE